jgi:hypothetical protein
MEKKGWGKRGLVPTGNRIFNLCDFQYCNVTKCFFNFTRDKLTGILSRRGKGIN